MTILVGVPPDGRGGAALHLATMMARSSGEELLLCTVVPEPWAPSPARVDAEYRTELARIANETLGAAREGLSEEVGATTIVHHARSAVAGLLEVAEQHDTRVIVVGSSPTGAFGRVAVGSVSSWLVHGSPVPVALPPRGYRCRPAARVTRVTAAYGGADGADDLVVAAGAVAARVGAALRIASFAVRAHPPYTSGVGTGPEQELLDQWAEEIEAASRAALERVSDLPEVPPKLDTVIGYGQTWDEALEDVDWQDGDVLVVGSSSVGPIARVFLGSRASKLVRYSPVPVVVVPRGRAAELAGDAVPAEPGPP
jgi:nucleotide-binding universal stress UspA family protein